MSAEDRVSGKDFYRLAKLTPIELFLQRTACTGRSVVFIFHSLIKQFKA